MAPSYTSNYGRLTRGIHAYAYSLGLAHLLRYAVHYLQEEPSNPNKKKKEANFLWQNSIRESLSTEVVRQPQHKHGMRGAYRLQSAVMFELCLTPLLLVSLATKGETQEMENFTFQV